MYDGTETGNAQVGGGSCGGGGVGRQKTNGRVEGHQASGGVGGESPISKVGNNNNWCLGPECSISNLGY